jgi:phospholipid/cholesterol/gamma-HCH transport system substrate-binding protein
VLISQGVAQNEGGMEAKREQALVGLFVVIATTVLVTTMFAIGGAFGTSGVMYRTYFKNAGGLEPGSIVRYAGLKVGRVERIHIDGKDPSRVELFFTVSEDTPVKADSLAKIASLSALGENFLQVSPGALDKPRAPKNTVLPSKEFFGITDVADILNELGPRAQTMLDNVNNRVVELQTTLARVNDLLNDQNRANLAGSFSHINGLLAEDRPKLHSTLSHVDETTAKLPALIDDFKKTLGRTDDALAKLDGVLGDNRANLKDTIAEMRKALADARVLIDQLNRTTVANADDIDEIIDNLRITTQNLQEFTDTIKTRPSTLIRSTEPPDHKPGQPPKP